MAQATYWVGQDGNVYYGSGQEGAGVWNLGEVYKPGENNANWIVKDDGIYDAWGDNGPVLQYGATRINDPSLQQRPSAPSGGGRGDTRPILDRLAVNNTQKSIDEIPGLREAALRAEQTNYNNTENEFNAQQKQQQGVYDESTVTNQKNHDSTFMDSIRSGIRGLGGLMNILRGTGASGGTAEDQARNIVGEVTAKDIRTGADTRNENQTALDTTLSSFMTELEGKRQRNKDALENNQRAIRSKYDTDLQKLYGDMAGYYGDAEMEGERATWMNKAGALTPSIAQNSRTRVSEYDTSPVKVQAPQLNAFAEPSQERLAVDPGQRQIGAGIFTLGNRREDRERQAQFAGA